MQLGYTCRNCNEFLNCKITLAILKWRYKRTIRGKRGPTTNAVYCDKQDTPIFSCSICGKLFRPASIPQCEHDGCYEQQTSQTPADSYLLHAFVIENAYQAAASREPKSGSLYK